MYLFTIMAVCQKKNQRPSMLATKQNKKYYKCNKNPPNLVHTVINTPIVISQYLFTSADKMK